MEQLSHDTETDIGEIAAALVWQAQQERPLFPKFAALPDASRGSVHGDRQRPNDRDRSPRRTNQGDSPRRPRQPRAPDANMQRYRIEAGHEHGVRPGDIVGALANEAGIDGEFIGSINIQESYSTVDLPEGMPKEVFDHLRRVRVRQQLMNITLIGSDDNDENRPGEKPKRTAKPHRKANTKAHSKHPKPTGPGPDDSPKKSSKPKKKLTLKKKKRKPADDQPPAN